MYIFGTQDAGMLRVVDVKIKSGCLYIYIYIYIYIHIFGTQDGMRVTDVKICIMCPLTRI